MQHRVLRIDSEFYLGELSDAVSAAHESNTDQLKKLLPTDANIEFKKVTRLRFIIFGPGETHISGIDDAVISILTERAISTFNSDAMEDLWQLLRKNDQTLHTSLVYGKSGSDFLATKLNFGSDFRFSISAEQAQKLATTAQELFDRKNIVPKSNITDLLAELKATAENQRLVFWA